MELMQLGLLVLFFPMGVVAIGFELKKPTAMALEQIQMEENLLKGFRMEGTAAASKEEGVGVTAATPSCDISADGPICLAEGKKVLLPPSVQPGVLAYYTFDEATPLDASGNGNHGATETFPGPAPGGHGASAFFREGTFLTIPNSVEMGELQDFSYTFWVYLVKDAAGPPATGLEWCPILRKGIHNPTTSMFENSPALLLDRKTRRLRVQLSTSYDQTENGEFVDSYARLNPHQWIHIAIVRLNDQKRTRLYVNGILDATAPTKGFTKPNDLPLYVGGDPWVSEQCDVPMYVDELRVYNRPLSPDEIQAEASPALTGVEPSFVRIACADCSLETAVQGCPEGYHVCTSLELHAGAYQVARSMGWLKQGTHVWTHATVANSLVQTQAGLTPSAGGTGSSAASTASATASVGGVGLGLCCLDSA